MLMIIAIFLFTLLACYNFKKHSYWANKGVYTPPTYPLFGHILNFFFKFWEYDEKIYKKAKKYEFSGYYEFFTPKLYVYKPEHLRHILVKDFDHFVDRRQVTIRSKEDKVLHDMLTNISGDRWKFIRATLTPAFTSGKLKAMFPLVSDIADRLVSMCQDAAEKNSPLEVNDALGRYALDVIACCAFGIEGKTIEQGESEFYNLVKKMNKLTFKAMMKFMLFLLTPKLFSILRFSFMTKDTRTLINIVKKSIEQRRKDSSAHRGDFVDLILEAEKSSNQKDLQSYNFDEDTMIAQSLLFLLAGYDTVMNTSTFILNDLAKYPEEQTKVREELLELTKDGDLTYQKVMEAKYLDAFICECMRLTPIATVQERKCTQNYKIPGTEITILEDQLVDIPVWSLHRDPEYWEDPLEFRPSRFLPENKDKIVPYTYLPFGLGPRNCIGNRFALMEMKLVMAKLVLAFEMSHPAGFEMKLKNTPQTLRPDSNGVLINFKPISKG